MYIIVNIISIINYLIYIWYTLYIYIYTLSTPITNIAYPIVLNTLYVYFKYVLNVYFIKYFIIFSIQPTYK